LNWVVIVWSMMAASSLTLGAVQLFVWFRRRAEYDHLLFFTLALSAAAIGGFELVLMQSTGPEAYATTLRWAHVPLTALVVSMVGFSYFYFNAGRAWLALTICGLRLLGLVLNFTTGANVNFREVIGLNRIEWWGEVVSAPIGVVNPWTVVPQLTNVLLIVFVIDASLSLWRRGGAVSRRRAVVVGGSMALCIGWAGGFAALTVTGAVHAPTFIMPGIFVLVMAMGYELVREVIRSAELSTQLRASEAKFRAVVHSIPNVILLVSDGGIITYANSQVQAIFGYTPEEAAGMQVDELVPQSARARHAANRREYGSDARARAMGSGLQLAGLRKDGTEIAVEVTLNPMRTADGMFVLASVVDVTERRRLEAAAARQRNELAHLSRVGMLGALSGSLAHELNQPLTAILSNAQAARRFLAQSPPRLDQVVEIIDDIVRNDRRAASIIQRLRALLKKEDAAYRPTDVNDMVQDSLRLMRSDLIGRRVEVVTQMEPRLPAVSADRVQLQQIMLNFVMNGCEAMDESAGPRRLLVRTGRAASGGVEVMVADNGPGIPAAELESIFEPFVTTKPQGVGLGLAICRTITDAHGGRIWATSNGDGGASLHFEIPVTQKDRLDADTRDRVPG